MTSSSLPALIRIMGTKFGPNFLSIYRLSLTSGPKPKILSRLWNDLLGDFWGSFYPVIESQRQKDPGVGFTNVLFTFATTYTIKNASTSLIQVRKKIYERTTVNISAPPTACLTKITKTLGRTLIAPWF